MQLTMLQMQQDRENRKHVEDQQREEAAASSHALLEGIIGTVAGAVKAYFEHTNDAIRGGVLTQYSQ